jgi:hypothetical protein
MPWCPKCKFEYVPQITHCPDCGAALVAALPEEPAPEAEYGEGAEFEQVVLCTLPDQIAATLLQNALHEAGVPTRVGAQERVGLFELAVNTWSEQARGVSIYVNRRDLAKATEVYRAYEGGDAS